MRNCRVIAFCFAALWFALTGLRGSPPPAALVFLGDSLTAGYGVAPGQAYPALVKDELARRSINLRVVNGGVSGDTTAGALRRLPWLLRQRPAWVVVALGGNDMLRAIPPAETEKHLDVIMKLIRASGARAVLLGMRAAPNLGPIYSRDFDELFPRVAKRHGVPFLPFYISPVAGNPALNQADGIHPTAKGHRLIADHLLKFLVPELGRPR